MRYLILITLLFIHSLNASSLLEYSASVEYQFDSNIGQNTTEVPGGYVTPNIAVTLYPIKNIPIFLYTDLVFDSYITERNFDDNSPLIDGGIGIKLGTKKFKYITAISFKQFIGMNVYTPNDSIGSSSDWISTLRTYTLKNDFRKKIKKSRVDLKTEISLIDYGDNVTDSGTIKNEKDAFNLNISSSYQHDFKFNKDIPARVKNVTLKLNYEGNFAYGEEEAFNKLTGTIGTDLKLLITTLSLDLSYSQKIYNTKRNHPNTNDLIDLKTNYIIIKSDITIPIISDLFIEVGGKLRFRNSNYPTYDYNRHTAYARILWNSSIKRKS